ncbi:hypothetical protein M3Y94_00917500 [Aphelenchoides besseyi]|nr:hypothetical protein M3Y94_00917500 [Aphelenchoides besseyi]
MTAGDTWASPLYEFYQADGPVKFYVSAFVNTQQADNPVMLEIKATKELQQIRVVKLWLEAANGAWSTPLEYTISKSEGRNFILNFKMDVHLNLFNYVDTFVMYIEFPFVVKCPRPVASEWFCLRWPIENFNESLLHHNPDFRGQSERFGLPKIPINRFQVRWEAPNLVFRQVGVKDSNTNFTLEYEIWAENNYSKRMPKHNEVFNLMGDVNFSAVHSFLTDEVLKQLRAGPLRICLDVRVWTEQTKEWKDARFIERIARTFNCEQYSDVVIEAEDKRFMVSKSIICAQSKVFYAMLTNPLNEKENGVIKMPSFSSQIVEVFLRFLYSGKVDNIDAVALELLDIADFYQVDRLIKICSDSVIKRLNSLNIMECLKAAALHEHVSPFKYGVLQYAKRNMKTIVQHPEFHNLGNLYPSIVVEMLQVCGQ